MCKNLLAALICLLVLSSRVSESESSKILFYFGSSIYSHKVAVWPLVLKLAEKGHEITFLSPPYPNANSPYTPVSNVKIFHPKALTIYWTEKDGNKSTRDAITSRIKGFSDGQGYWDGSLQTALEICRVIFRSLEVQDWVEKASFDLIVIDTPYNECALGLAHKFNAPHVLFGTTSFYMWHQEMFGLPDETSWLPNYYYHFPTDMSFLQRVRNALTPLQWFYSTNRVSYIMPQMEKLMRKSLNNVDDMPSFDELETSTSLFLLNTHFIQEYPRSLPPFVISIGGMHLINPSPQDMTFSDELVEFLDKYTEKGFIYLSFGTQVEFSRAPSLVVEKLISTFSLIDMPVLWKWDDMEKVPEKSEKIFMSKWFPQTDILAHPKIKLFITNGGTLSHQEAIFFGVPVIAFPLNPEEDYNSALIQKSIMGFRMDILYFTQYELATNIQKIVKDETYKNNVMKLSELFRDRPQSPVETASWWTEYAIRHKNLSFAKPLAINQPWYQRRLLDVWAFLGLIIFGSLTLLVVSVNYVFCKNNPPQQMKVTKHKLKTS